MTRNQDQLFSNMLCAAQLRLQGRNPRQVARLANVTFDHDTFLFESLGRKISATYPDYSIAPSIDSWHVLTILHYLALADGTPPTGNFISFAQHRDGMVRGGGFDREIERIIQQKIGAFSEDILTQRCIALGAEIIQTNADFCAEFHFMPNYPVRMKIWFADEEFPPSGRMFLDSSAEHYLSIEDAVTVGTLILEQLSR